MSSDVEKHAATLMRLAQVEFAAHSAKDALEAGAACLRTSGQQQDRDDYTRRLKDSTDAIKERLDQSRSTAADYAFTPGAGQQEEEITRLQALRVAEIAAANALTKRFTDQLIDKVKELEAQLAALQRPSGATWLPIESAPKDGTVVDLFTPAGGRLTNCKFSAALDTWTYKYGPEYHQYLKATPTHWMPLPPVPAPSESP